MITWRCTCRASKDCPASAYTDLLYTSKSSVENRPQPTKMCSVTKMSYYQNVCYQNVLLSKCRVTEMSVTETSITRESFIKISGYHAVNSNGPSTEPCGTPNVTFLVATGQVGLRSEPLKRSACDPESVKEPAHKSMVSNAAVRSSVTNIITQPRSTAHIISL